MEKGNHTLLVGMQSSTGIMVNNVDSPKRKLEIELSYDTTVSNHYVEELSALPCLL
jgi:hypothetical protein